MAAKLGSTDVSFRLGVTTPAAVYLGSEQVWSAATVPDAPTITSAVWDSGLGFTLIQYSAPASDGGSAITGHRLYVDGVAVLPDSDYVENREFYQYSNLTGSTVEVSVENAIGEGPKSAPFTVVAP